MQCLGHTNAEQVFMDYLKFTWRGTGNPVFGFHCCLFVSVFSAQCLVCQHLLWWAMNVLRNMSLQTPLPAHSHSGRPLVRGEWRWVKGPTQPLPSHPDVDGALTPRQTLHLAAPLLCSLALCPSQSLLGATDHMVWESWGHPPPNKWETEAQGSQETWASSQSRLWQKLGFMDIICHHYGYLLWLTSIYWVLVMYQALAQKILTITLWKRYLIISI